MSSFPGTQASAPAAAEPPTSAIRFRELLRDWRPSLLVALSLFIVTRLVSEGVVLLANFGGGAPARAAAGRDLVGPWERWDAGWYLGIAQHGYVALSHVPAGGGRFYDGVAFPPLYPMAIRVLSRVTHLTPGVAGFVISALALLVALVLLHRLVLEEFGVRVAFLACLFLLLYPAALFFEAPYTESMQLLFITAGFYAARHGRWLLAGIAVGLAAVTKIYLLVLLAPLGYLLFLHMRGKPRSRAAIAVAELTVPAVLPLVGWMAYLEATFGQPLRFLSAPSAWRSTTFPWLSIGRSVRQLLDGSVLHNFLLQAAVSDLAAVLALLVLAIWVFLRVSRVYGATLFLAFLAIASAGGAPPLWLYSATRYVAVWFPVFIGLAVLVARRPWAAGALAVALAAAQVQLLTLFATGQWAG